MNREFIHPYFICNSGHIITDSDVFNRAIDWSSSPQRDIFWTGVHGLLNYHLYIGWGHVNDAIQHVLRQTTIDNTVMDPFLYGSSHEASLIQCVADLHKLTNRPELKGLQETKLLTKVTQLVEISLKRGSYV